jgi:ribose transport system ATP-binding protein
MSVAENMTLAHLRRFKTGAVVDRRREKHAVAQWIERLQISTSSPASRAAELSGGNQQKLALAKWLIGERPRVLLLDHPLRGLDVAASAEICEALRELANEGVGVLMIADTLEELLALSDSVLVLRDGRICARLSVAEDQPQPADILARMI